MSTLSVTSESESSLHLARSLGSGGIAEEFVREFTRTQRRLYHYILSQVGNPIEAEEILQESNVVILNKHAQFVLGTNFFAWACRIASFEVMKHRDRRRRDKHLFSDEFVQTIAQAAEEHSDEHEQRRIALGICLGKLRPKDRELIEQRYAPGETGKNLAEEVGRPTNSVYQSLGRIRRTLLECIQRQLATGTES